MPINLSLVLPCYNEEKNIAFLCNEFLTLSFNDIKAELILVNNGSEDNTKSEIDKAINNNINKNISIKLVHLKEYFLRQISLINHFFDSPTQPI